MLRRHRISVPYAKDQVRHAAKELSLVTWNDPEEPLIEVEENRGEVCTAGHRRCSQSQMQQCRPTVPIHSSSTHPSFTKLQPPNLWQEPFIYPFHLQLTLYLESKIEKVVGASWGFGSTMSMFPLVQALAQRPDHARRF